MNPFVHPFFDPTSCTYSYVVVDPLSRQCAIIDAVLDFDADTESTTTTSADSLADFIQCNHLHVAWVLETHVHADHVSAAPYLRAKFPQAKVAIGAGIAQLYKQMSLHNGQRLTFDVLLEDGHELRLGNITGTALATPGHTPVCMTFLFGDCAFVGDTLFMPDFGTARCDFPGGNAETLFQSIQRLFALPTKTQLYMCHDYAPGGRAYRYCTTVAEERAHNIHVNQKINQADFVRKRMARDATLAPPKLLHTALAHNL